MSCCNLQGAAQWHCSSSECRERSSWGKEWALFSTMTEISPLYCDYSSYMTNIYHQTILTFTEIQHYICLWFTYDPLVLAERKEEKMFIGANEPHSVRQLTKNNNKRLPKTGLNTECDTSYYAGSTMCGANKRRLLCGRSFEDTSDQDGNTLRASCGCELPIEMAREFGSRTWDTSAQLTPAMLHIIIIKHIKVGKETWLGVEWIFLRNVWIKQ